MTHREARLTPQLEEQKLDKEVRSGRMADPLRSYLAKTDLNTVFRLLPIYPGDFDFLCSKCNG